MKRILMLVIVSSLFLDTYAQVPQGFSYQAVIRDSEGNPIAAQLVGLRISLRNENGLTVYYSETHSTTTTLQGVVSLTIGNGSIVSGTIEGIPWSEGNIYIKIEVDPTGGISYTTLGQSKLQAVPYAMYTLNGVQGPQGVPGAAGPAGPAGSPGENGIDGLSAYQIWLNHGGEGTMEDFLQSLIGETGEQGISAYDIWISLGNEGTVEEFIQSLRGEDGIDGEDGLSALQIWLSLGNEGDEEMFIASLKGEPGEDGEPGVGIASTVDNGNGTFTIYYSDASSFTTINLIGPAGLNGKTVLSGADAPTTGIGFDGDFYINTTDKTIYGPKTTGDWGTATSLVGPKGETGTGLTNKGNWVTGTTYDPGDYVFYCSNAECLTTSMWIVEAAEPFESTTAPYLDPSKWVEFTAPEGPQGPTGPPGPLVTGAINQILRNVDGGTTWEPTSNVYVTSTNVGVGTTSTPAKLTIWGTTAAPSIPSAASSAILRIGNTSYSTEGIDIGHMNSSPWAGWIQVGDNTTAEPLSLQPAGGNVGIGTTSPSQRLDVDGQIRIRGGSPGTGKLLTSDANGIASWGTTLPSHSHAATDITSETISVANGGTGQSTLAQNKILVGNGTTGILQPTNLHWDNTNSRLGIGTDAPSQQLDMTGQIRIRGGSPGTGKVLTATDATGLASWQIAPEGSKWTLSGSNIYRSTGLVGIGTTAPARTLEVVGGATGVETILMQVRSNFNTTSTQSTFRFVNSSSSTATIGSEISSIRTNLPTAGSSDLLFRTSLGTAMTERMRITASGNVGVGTTTPASKLVVSGGDPTEAEPIFAVRNNQGKLVFGVYQTGVRIYVDDTQSKTNKAGFAIGGLTGQKEGELEYLRVTPDSVRILLREPTGKTNKAGFAIGGLTGPKTSASLMHLTPENYFIGHQSGEAITTGTKNTFFGYQSGISATSGFANIFIGQESGLSTTEGKRNIFIGYQAGKLNQGILTHNTIGHDNIYIGGQTGRDNTSGEHNTFVGSQSGIFSTGTKNTFYGAFTGLSATGTANVFLGLDAGRENNAGNNNLFVGAIAGMKNSGSNNTYIGYGAGWTSAASSGSNNVFLGYQAGVNVTASNRLYIANASGTPLIYGEFDNKKLTFNITDLTLNNSGGRSRIVLNGTSDNNVVEFQASGTYKASLGWQRANEYFFIYQGGNALVAKANKIGIAGVTNPSQALTVGGNIRLEGGNRWIYFNGGDGVIQVDGTTNHLWFNVGGSYQMALLNNGRLGVGLTNPSYRIDLPNTADVDGRGRSNQWVVYSDARIKSNQKPLPYGLAEIMQLKPLAYFHHNSTVEDNTIKIMDTGSESIGLLAQEVIDIIPEVVSRPQNQDTDLWGMSYDKLVPVLIKAIQEQQTEIELLKSELKAIRDKLSE
jgi:hypothetical protein